MLSKLLAKSSRKVMSYMRFRQQLETQLATSFSTENETILMDYNDVIYHGRRLQAQEVGRLIGLV